MTEQEGTIVHLAQVAEKSGQTSLPVLSVRPGNATFVHRRIQQQTIYSLRDNELFQLGQKEYEVCYYTIER
jgi:hypothetical protein